MKKIFAVMILITVMGVFSSLSFAQPSSLSDRELLIQLHSKLEFIEATVKRIEGSSLEVNRKIVTLDKQVTKNEMNIAGFYDKLEDLVSRWNYLLGLFVTFITGIFVWMWRRNYNGKDNKLVKNSK